MKEEWHLFGLSTPRTFYPPTFLGPGERTAVGAHVGGDPPVVANSPHDRYSPTAVAPWSLPPLWLIRVASSVLTLKWGRRFGLTATTWPLRGFRPLYAL